MSYILEALKKSERARREIEGEPLLRMTSEPPPPSRSKWRWVPLVALLAVNISALAYFLMRGSSTPHPVAASPAAPAAPPVATSRPAEPPSREMPPGADEEGSAEAPALAHPERGRFGAGPAAVARPPSPARQVGANTGHPTREHAPPPPPDEALPDEPELQDEDPTPHRAGGLARLRRQLREEPDPPQAAAPAAKGAGPYGDMKVTIYAYSPTSASDRFVVIRSRKYREGDRIEDGALIRRIEENAMTLEANGETFRVPRP